MTNRFLSRANRRFHKSEPGSMYESAVQSIVQKNIPSLFPDYFGKIYEPFLQTPAGNVKPDLVLIHREYTGWVLVEVEVEGHSEYGHILPQLTKLTYASANDAVISDLTNHYEQFHNASDIERALSFSPEVFLVIHGSSKNIEQQLLRIGVTALDVDIFTNAPDEPILQVHDRSDNYVAIGVECYRSNSPFSPYVWILEASANLPEGEWGGEVEVIIGDAASRWSIQKTGANYMLRQPSNVKSLSGINQVNVFRHRNQPILKFDPI